MSTLNSPDQGFQPLVEGLSNRNSFPSLQICNSLHVKGWKSTAVKYYGGDGEENNNLHFQQRHVWRNEVSFNQGSPYSSQGGGSKVQGVLVNYYFFFQFFACNPEQDIYG